MGKGNGPGNMCSIVLCRYFQCRTELIGYPYIQTMLPVITGLLEDAVCTVTSAARCLAQFWKRALVVSGWRQAGTK